MAITVTCPGCGKTFKVGDTAEGKKGACPFCSTFIVVGHPHAPEPAKPPEPAWKPGDVFPVFSGHRGRVNSVAVSTGGTIAVTAGDDGTVRFWDIESGRETMRLEGHDGPVNSAALSVDGSFAVSGGADKTVRLWHTAKGKCVRVFAGHTDAVTSVTFYPRGGYAFSAGLDGTIRFWELGSGKPGGVCKGHDGGVTSVAADPEGQLLISGGVDATVRLWRADKAKAAGKMKGHGGPVRSVAFNSDGGLAVSGADDRLAVVWSVGRQKALKVFKGHQAAVRSVAISSDNALAATGSVDWTLRIWNVDTAKSVFTLEADEQWVTAVAIVPGGREVISGNRGGALRLWDAKSGKLIRTLGGTERSAPTRCPSCGKVFDVAQALIGLEGLCPFCQAKFAASPYSPPRSEESARRGRDAVADGQFVRAARDFDEAIRWQGDSHAAILDAIACRNKIGAGLEEEGKHAQAVEILGEALKLYSGDNAWPLDLITRAHEEAYKAAFLAGKICRFRLEDSSRAVAFLQFARRINNTLEVSDMLAHISAASGQMPRKT